ncbi:MAG TPA: NRDE family protein [Gemmatimonadales bacterium]|nr:NRDE family protein [Gemmatimonadales bacterium]
MSWLPGPGGYLLCFNRDESRTRGPGLPPSWREVRGLEILAPTDSDAGGSWIGVNAAGVALGLANRYGPKTPAPINPISRGLLVLQLLELATLGEVDAELGRAELKRYRPFTLIAAEPGAPAGLWSWSGTESTMSRIAEPGLLITSSAVDQEGAEAARRALFLDAARDPGLSKEILIDLHRSHRPERGGHSICMHRTDACTVSLTTIEVTTDLVTIAHAPGSPCITPLGPPLTALRRSVRDRG